MGPLAGSSPPQRTRRPRSPAAWALPAPPSPRFAPFRMGGNAPPGRPPFVRRTPAAAARDKRPGPVGGVPVGGAGPPRRALGRQARLLLRRHRPPRQPLPPL